jgi:outer membrane protein assembly factor BamB
MMVIQRAKLEEARDKRKKRRRIIWLSVAGALVIFILFYYLAGFTDVFIGSGQKTVDSNPPSQDQWTMFRRDLDRTGASPADQLTPSGTIKWSFAAADVIHSSPAVVDGIVYFGSRDSHLYAVDAATGQKLWSFETGSWVESSPIVVDGVVYFGCNDSNLYAVDAKTGVEKWHFPTVYAVRSSPAYANGIVYIGTDSYRVYAVNAETGKEVWSKMTDDIVISAPAVSNGIVAVGCADGLFYTFNAGNGRSRLEFDDLKTVNASPAIRDNVAYYADNVGNFYALDITQKNWLWENKTRQYWNVLYVYGVAPKPPPPSGYLWNNFLAFGVNTVTSPALSGDFAYLGVGKNMMSVDLNSHQKGWTFATGDAVTSSPAVTSNAVLFGSQDGSVYALDKTTGTQIWSLDLGGKVTSSPAVVNGTLYVGCHDGKLYAIE